MVSDSAPELVRRALELLGKRKLVLSIHDGSFPGESDEDLGRGTPYSAGGRRLVGFVRGLGFNGLQLGPQGLTSRGNPSPYDGTAFSRNSLSIALGALVRDPEWGTILSEEDLRVAIEGLREAHGNRVPYESFHDAHVGLLERAFEGFERARRSSRTLQAQALELAAFCDRNREWLEPDSLYEALIEEHGSEDWRRWPDTEAGGVDRRLCCPAAGEHERARRRRTEIQRTRAGRIGFYSFCQFTAHQQHWTLQSTARSLGLELFADLQIGLSLRDVWALRSLFLPGYALGAPPSRTNPTGQPWGYPVFDPAGYGTMADGPVVRLLRRRIDKLFEEYDGLRIDHPQGLVCPWVYRRDDPDPLHAVQNGARLFAAPNFPDHPLLAAYAIPRPEQLAATAGVARYDDAWVRSLEPEQVERYAVLVSVIVETARRHGRGSRQIACEILSTLPYPLRRVIRLHALGRFRVTQKSDPRSPDDVYRSDNAEAEDWIMLGTHDTPPIWALVTRWFRDGQAPDRAAYLAGRLAPSGAVEGYRREFLQNPGRLVHAELADALVSRAEQVLVFFADLFGLEEVYNTPGSVGPQNWGLRVPADYQRTYPRRASALQALNLPHALALALGSPLRGLASTHRPLIEKLQAAARTMAGPPPR